MGAVRDWDSKMGVPRKRERERETFASSKASLSHS
jgi:hypothetical protein